jgi:hypothetical protein
MNDKWSRLINFKYGPDGSVYCIDWYDKQACHNPLTEIWDRTNGRIYKFIYKNQPGVQVDLTKKTDEELVQLTLDKNDFLRPPRAPIAPGARCERTPRRRCGR